jgi:hypothetical protein
MGYLFLAGSQCLPGILPGVYLLPQPVQLDRFCDQLYFDSSVRIVCDYIQILEQDSAGQVGGNGYLDWSKGACGCGRDPDCQETAGVVVAHLFGCYRIGWLLRFLYNLKVPFDNESPAVIELSTIYSMQKMAEDGLMQLTTDKDTQIRDLVSTQRAGDDNSEITRDQHGNRRGGSIDEGKARYFESKAPLTELSYLPLNSIQAM